MREQYDRSIEGKGGCQQKLTDSQGNPTRAMWVRLIGRWSTRESADGKREGNQGYAKGKT
jgi:hypothetical protein